MIPTGDFASRAASVFNDLPITRAPLIIVKPSDYIDESGTDHSIPTII